MNKTTSVHTHSLALSSTESPHPTTVLSDFKQRLKAIKRKWGPLMAAKEHLDDDYNFPPGRYAGQDDSRVSRQWSVPTAKELALFSKLTMIHEYPELMSRIGRHLAYYK